MSLMSLGWNERLASTFEPYRERGLEAGRVVTAGGGSLRVAGDLGELTAITAGRLEDDGEPGPVTVGDWVGMDTTTGTPVVRVILPRSSALTRRRPGAAERCQVMAANVEMVLLVDGLDRGPNPRRIERGVALAYDSGVEPIVVLSKADVCVDVAAAVALARLAAPFAEVMAVSAATGAGVSELESALRPGSTSVLLGPSGGGKSTLVNRLLGEERMRIGAVRRQDRRGRHTTTHRQLVEIAAGACLIDSPGIRELGLWLDAAAVDAAFAEVEAHAARCRFRDCRHGTEPGCAVQAAVAAGEIAADRFAAYRELRLEAEAHQRRRSAQAQRSHERRFARMVRQVKKLKG
jgi:ribosome biogenesis GTPase / thiamine phosphate phosphatase